jgi:hypothetical protein
VLSGWVASNAVPPARGRAHHWRGGRGLAGGQTSLVPLCGARVNKRVSVAADSLQLGPPVAEYGLGQRVWRHPTRTRQVGSYLQALAGPAAAAAVGFSVAKLGDSSRHVRDGWCAADNALLA